MYGANDLRTGVKIMLDGDPCTIVDSDFVKPGKGQAFTRVKYRNLKTGRVLERTFKSNESVEAADIVETDMQFLYTDGQHWHFMVQDTYAQHEVTEAAVADAKSWLKEQDICSVLLWDGIPIAVTPPKSVILRVTESEPAVRGDTATGATKLARLETGVEVKVPLFVEEGDLIKVNTATGDYISRAKEE